MSASDDPHAKAYQAIGEYFCAFSAVEHELGEAIKVVYGLQNNDASDAIVAALGDFSRKGRLVQAAITVAKNADGSETSEASKADAGATIRKALGFNDPDRTLLAHATLQPNDDGSVDFVRLQVRDGKVTGRNAINWSKGAFSTKISQLKEVAKELQSMNENLRAVKITIPTGDLSWMTDDPFTANFTRRVPSGALWNQSTDPAPDVPKK